VTRRVVQWISRADAMEQMAIGCFITSGLFLLVAIAG
jgi:hypothetical protein